MTPNKLPPLPKGVKVPTGNTHPLADQWVIVYGADEMHAYAAEAIRQSQSLPAGAVAGLVDDWRRKSHVLRDLGERRQVTDMLVDCADQLGVALQADAREKGEAFAGYVGDNGDFYWPDLPQGRIDKLRSEGTVVREVFYATHPAQASEAVDIAQLVRMHGVDGEHELIRRLARENEIYRLRYGVAIDSDPTPAGIAALATSSQETASE